MSFGVCHNESFAKFLVEARFYADLIEKMLTSYTHHVYLSLHGITSTLSLLSIPTQSASSLVKHPLKVHVSVLCGNNIFVTSATSAVYVDIKLGG